MAITGKLYIAGAWQDGVSGGFQAVEPTTGEVLGPTFVGASNAQMDEALTAAAKAAPILCVSSLAERSKFLNACADAIMALGDELLKRFCQETGYPRMRAEGERGRTCGQLRMFADYILTGTYLDARIDTAQPDRAPVPKPDLRSLNQSLGPVVVFGASNFPFAYSVAGGDTASAFAAGCPVIVKGHPSHPGVCELVTQAIASAEKICNMPEGTFSLINGNSNDVGAYLVQASQVKAVGSTGSLAGGLALFRLANNRPEPIPVFAEMGSINPIFLLQQSLLENAESIAQNFVASLNMGTGQFCVNPGLIVAVKGPALDRFIRTVSEIISLSPSAVMLNEKICKSYFSGASGLAAIEGVEIVQKGSVSDGSTGFYAQTQFLRASAQVFLSQPELQEEVFGPCSLLVVCDDSKQMLEVARGLKGQLTGTIHATETELYKSQDLVSMLTTRVGRVVVNGFPTGVEVAPPIVHGGPFPASTDARFTAVGTAAIKRFIRPVCFQNFPGNLLPDALRDSNPLNLTRTINGELTDLAL